jgi:hypothetical protein
VCHEERKFMYYFVHWNFCHRTLTSIHLKFSPFKGEVRLSSREEATSTSVIARRGGNASATRQSTLRDLPQGRTLRLYRHP